MTKKPCKLTFQSLTTRQFQSQNDERQPNANKRKPISRDRGTDCFGGWHGGVSLSSSLLQRQETFEPRIESWNKNYPCLGISSLTTFKQGRNFTLKKIYFFLNDRFNFSPLWMDSIKKLLKLKYNKSLNLSWKQIRY